MKRKVMGAMAVMMAASLLAGCGSSSSSQATSSGGSSEAAETTTETAEAAEASSDGTAADITLWTYPIGSWGNSDTVDTLLAAFNESYPDIHVEVQYLDYTNGDDQVNTAIEGGQAPDLIMEGPERLVANWGAKGYMVDLSDIFSGDNIADMGDSIIAACTAADGSVYEYALCSVAHCMAINYEMFEAADALQYLDEETHRWNSTEDFLKAIQAVYDNGQQNVIAVYCGGQGGDQGTRALITNMYSGQYASTDHTEYIANSEQNAKALQALVDQAGINFDAGIVAGDEIQLFRQEQLAVSLCWNAAQQNNTDNGEAGKTNNGSTIFPMEFPTDDDAIELQGGIWGFGIFDNGDADKIAAAKTFINYMCNENAAAAVQASGFFPVHSDLTGIYEGTDIADTMDMYQATFLPDLGDYYQVTKGWATARTEWWNMLQRVGTGGDPATELQTFVDNANAAAAAES